MFKAKAVIHSLSKKASDPPAWNEVLGEVLILHEDGSNDVVAEYNGVRYTAIFNPFVCHYYVDDLYGKLPDQHKCPVCGGRL